MNDKEVNKTAFHAHTVLSRNIQDFLQKRLEKAKEPALRKELADIRNYVRNTCLYKSYFWKDK